jgi:hypothetical protein
VLASFPVWRRVQLLATAAALLAAIQNSQGAAAANPIVNSGGFESYTLGPLQGQQGWLMSGAGGSSATVQSTVVQAGTKAVQVQRAANSDSRWGVPVTGYPTHRYIGIDWDMRVTPTGAPAGTFGPFFGVEAYDATPTIGLLGSLGVDATTGDILYQPHETGALTETGSQAVFNTWNNFRILLDFTQHQYRVFANGTLLATSGFVDHSVSQPLNDFTDADLAALAAGPGASASQTGTAYFDNFRVWEPLPGDFDIDGNVDGADLAVWKTAFTATAQGDADFDGDSDGADFLLWQRNLGGDVLATTAAASAIPEPGSFALAVLAAGGLTRRRRR